MDSHTSPTPSDTVQGTGPRSDRRPEAAAPEDGSGLALSFGRVAERYDRGRPTYPAEAATWVAGTSRSLVLELGAGTGKFTEQLATLGHEVIATDPAVEMARIIPSRAPRAMVALASAENLPITDQSVDAVVCAQAFHWFDAELALPEIARVLRPGGVLAMVWNVRDDRIPWVKRLGRIIGNPENMFRPSLEPVEASEYFGPLESETFRIWQPLRRADLHDLVLSRSSISVMPEPEQQAKVREVDALYDEYGRGPDGMLLPYLTHCYRARLVASPPPRPTPEPRNLLADDADTSALPSGPRVQDTDDGHILIDFR